MPDSSVLEGQRLISEKKNAFQRVFDETKPDVNYVLEELAKFCRAHESTFDADPRIAAQLDGRREVWLLIQKQLNLSVEEIYELHRAKLDSRQKMLQRR